jgi:hypothetical protein
MDRAPATNIFGLREPVLPRATGSPARFAAARERALAHPLVGSQLLSADGGTALLLVDIDWLSLTEDADCTSRLGEAARQAAAGVPGLAIEFQITGYVPLRLRDADITRGNERKYQLIGYGMALAIAWVLFRGWEAVLSDSRAHQLFAAMGIMTISAALLADLVVLPALSQSWLRRRVVTRRRTEQSTLPPRRACPARRAPRRACRLAPHRPLSPSSSPRGSGASVLS